MKVGDRVAEMDSYYVGTVICAWDNSCVVEYDAHGRYLNCKCTEYKYYTGFSGVAKAKPYQEFHNACGMLKDGIPTCIPQSPYGDPK